MPALNPADPPTDAPWRLWVLSDGKPGHQTQSRGVARALARLAPVEEHQIPCTLRLGLSRRPLTRLLNGSDRSPPMALLRAAYRLPPLPPQPPHWILSAGGNTMFANAILARHYRCRNLFIGSLRRLAPRHFTAVFSMSLQAPNAICPEVSITTVEPDTAAEAGAVFRRQHQLEQTRLWTLLVGGDGAGYRYTSTDWEQLAEDVCQLADRHAVRWLITTSRRTGPEAEARLRALLPPEILADAVWYCSQPRKVMIPFLGAAEAIFCTEDSMSMINEAIAAGRPVFTLRPAEAAPEERFLQALRRQQDAARLKRLPIVTAAGLPADALQQFAPLRQSPIDLAARQLADFLAPAE